MIHAVAARAAASAAAAAELVASATAFASRASTSVRGARLACRVVKWMECFGCLPVSQAMLHALAPMRCACLASCQARQAHLERVDAPQQVQPLLLQPVQLHLGPWERKQQLSVPSTSCTCSVPPCGSDIVRSGAASWSGPAPKRTCSWWLRLSWLFSRRCWMAYTIKPLPRATPAYGAACTNEGAGGQQGAVGAGRGQARSEHAQLLAGMCGALAAEATQGTKLGWQAICHALQCLVTLHRHLAPC